VWYTYTSSLQTSDNRTLYEQMTAFSKRVSVTTWIYIYIYRSITLHYITLSDTKTEHSSVNTECVCGVLNT